MLYPILVRSKLDEARDVGVPPATTSYPQTTNYANYTNGRDVGVSPAMPKALTGSIFSPLRSFFSEMFGCFRKSS